MPTKITINSIIGETPYDVYVCDNPITVCIYIATIDDISLPYEFELPCSMDNQDDYTLKTVDNVGCVDIKVLSL